MRSVAEKDGLVVAIDGPAGAGKSTLGRRLARAMGLAHINTGTMYRAVAARAIASGIDPEDVPALVTVARTIGFDLDRRRTPPELSVDGEAPSPDLESAQVEAVVSEVSRHPDLRAVLRARQRALGAGGAVMEGRDIGTVVFPDADVKILLLARPSVRASRRRQERGGAREAAAAVARRDELDSLVSPLVPTADATVLDTSSMSPDEVYREALELVRRARAGS